MQEIRNNQNFLHIFFYSLNQISYIFLLLGLIIWIICPIIGIIPLLIFAQIKASKRFKKSKRKFKLSLIYLFILLLVCFTFAISISTRTISNDLSIYINNYESLGGSLSFWEYMTLFNQEPLAYVIPNLLKTLFNANSDVFLLVQALTLNLGFIACAIIFMPYYSPIIILLNVTSATYFTQLHLMRQFYSFIFLVPFVYVISLRLKLIFASLAMATHSSSIPFLAIGIISSFIQESKVKTKNKFNSNQLFPFLKKITSKIKNTTNKIIRNSVFTYILFLILVISIPVVLFMMQRYNTILAQLIPIPGFGVTFNRYSDLNSSVGVDQDFWKGMLFELLFLIPSVIILNFKKAGILSYSWSLMLLVSGIYLLGFYFIANFMGRFMFLLSGLAGFFYTIILDSNQLNDRGRLFANVILLAIFTKINYFLYRIIKSSFESSSSIWEGNPLGANIVDYINYLYSIFFN